MKKQYKPPIKPEERRDWLRRSEENGEYPRLRSPKKTISMFAQFENR